MIRPQAPDAPSADWTLADDEVVPEPVVVVPLVEAVVDPAGTRRAFCPVCGPGQPMQFAVTSDGTRYDHCVGCGLLWRVDGELEVVVGTRLVPPRAVGLP
jgi:hypothetical protein